MLNRHNASVSFKMQKYRRKWLRKETNHLNGYVFHVIELINLNHYAPRKSPFQNQVDFKWKCLYNTLYAMKHTEGIFDRFGSMLSTRVKRSKNDYY